jgi:hypothetical protein
LLPSSIVSGRPPSVVSACLRHLGFGRERPHPQDKTSMQMQEAGTKVTGFGGKPVGFTEGVRFRSKKNKKFIKNENRF